MSGGSRQQFQLASFQSRMAVGENPQACHGTGVGTDYRERQRTNSKARLLLAKMLQRTSLGIQTSRIRTAIHGWNIPSRMAPAVIGSQERTIVPLEVKGRDDIIDCKSGCMNHEFMMGSGYWSLIRDN